MHLLLKNWELMPAIGYRNKSGKNLLLINEIRSYYRNDAKALAAYVVINWINIFLAVVIMLLWETNASMDFSDSPYDYVLDFVEQGYDDMAEFMNQNKDAIGERHILKSLEGITDGGWEVILIPEADYNEMTGKALKIEKGHMVVLSQLDRSMVNITTEPDGREWHFWEIDYEIPVNICGYH